MRKIVTLTALLVAMVGFSAAPALAGGVSVPKNCQEINELLHIDNVRDCDNS